MLQRPALDVARLNVVRLGEAAAVEQEEAAMLVAVAGPESAQVGSHMVGCSSQVRLTDASARYADDQKPDMTGWLYFLE